MGSERCIRDSSSSEPVTGSVLNYSGLIEYRISIIAQLILVSNTCLLYTSDAADDLLCVDLGGRRIINKKKQSIFDISV